MRITCLVLLSLRANAKDLLNTSIYSVSTCGEHNSRHLRILQTQMGKTRSTMLARIIGVVNVDTRTVFEEQNLHYGSVEELLKYS